LRFSGILFDMSKVAINNKAVKRIRGGHLWIFKSDLLAIDADGGTIVDVFDETNSFIAKAFYSDKSEISLRILTLENVTIDFNFWKQRFKSALSRRKGIEKFTNAFRVINSEADFIPSLILDCYNGVFVLQTLSQATDTLKPTFVKVILELFPLAIIVERNDAKVRLLEGLEIVNGVLHGKLPDEIIIEQDELRFSISPLSGQKTGSFLDQRENHFAVRKYAFGKALDCFTFNGGFALNLAKVCESVIGLDISRDAVLLSKKNAELNGLTNVKFKTANVLEALRVFEMKREKFDTIVLDPPAFVKSKSALNAAIRGYREINLRAMKLLNENGILITCSCSFHFSEEIFLNVIEECARDSRRRVQLIEKRVQPVDHPILLGMPESYYLKCFILRVI
jgi:23S rRNA (cytosine1962-C5)-methyltransferase